MSPSESSTRPQESRLSVVRGGGGAQPADQSLAAALATLARNLHREKAPEDVMQEIVASAVGLVEGAEHASISVVRGRKQVWSAAATDEVARSFDKLQETIGEGPCLDAMFLEAVVRCGDVAVDDRWPGLASGALDLGVRSMLCFQLFVRDNSLGGLNLLSSQENAFDDDAGVVGSMVAAHAAVALAGAQEFHDLTTALANRDVIGQAKGILMERFKIGADQAFALLARVSQDRNVKLHHVAEELTRSGSLES